MGLDELRQGAAEVETLESGTEIGRDADGKLMYARWRDGTTQYYENSVMTSIEKPDGTFIKYTDGKVDYFTDPRGNKFVYDENGKISTFIDKDSFVVKYEDGKPVAVTDPSMRTFVMDKEGNISIDREAVFEDTDPARKALKSVMSKDAHNAEKIKQLAMAHALGAIERGNIEQTINRNTIRLLDAMNSRGR